MLRMGSAHLRQEQEKNATLRGHASTLQNFDFIRDFTRKPMSTKEAVLGCAAKDAIDVDAGMIVVVTTKGACCYAVGLAGPRWLGFVKCWLLALPELASPFPSPCSPHRYNVDRLLYDPARDVTLMPLT